MHLILGYSLAEIASIVAILAGVFGLFGWIFRQAMKSVLTPLSGQIQQLVEKLTSLNHNFDKQDKQIIGIREKLGEHDRRLDRHHEQIKEIKEDIRNEED